MLGRLVTKVFWWLLTRGWLPDSILRWSKNNFFDFLLEGLDLILIMSPFRWRIRQGLVGLMAKMDKEAAEYGSR